LYIIISDVKWLSPGNIYLFTLNVLKCFCMEFTSVNELAY
jgi:hypothetical protein